MCRQTAGQPLTAEANVQANRRPALTCGGECASTGTWRGKAWRRQPFSQPQDPKPGRSFNADDDSPGVFPCQQANDSAVCGDSEPSPTPETLQNAWNLAQPPGFLDRRPPQKPPGKPHLNKGWQRRCGVIFSCCGVIGLLALVFVQKTKIVFVKGERMLKRMRM